MSPEQLLGQLERNGQVVVADFEAGLGTLARMESGSVDLLLVVVEPTQKSIQVALRAMAVISERQLGRAVLIGNRIANSKDRELITNAFPGHSVVLVPEESGIRQADVDGRAPFDTVPDSPAVSALRQLASSLVD